MKKLTDNGHAERPFLMEHYAKIHHMNPSRRGYTKDPWSSKLSAVRALVLARAEKVVCVKRASGRVQWTRIIVGGQILVQSGNWDESGRTWTLQVPGTKS